MPSDKPRLGKIADTLFTTEALERPRQEAATAQESDIDLWRQAEKLAQVEPRISFVSLKAKVVLIYLRKTTPEFNISKVTAMMVEEAVREKYPELWKRTE